MRNTDRNKDPDKHNGTMLSLNEQNKKAFTFSSPVFDLIIYSSVVNIGKTLFIIPSKKYVFDTHKIERIY